MSLFILLTGAAGFIGYHLAQALHLQGHRVLGVDNFNPYYDPQLKRRRADKLKTLNIPIVEVDLCDYKSLNNLCEQNNFTNIVHLAAQVGVRYSVTNPQAYVKSNIEGFTNILELCRHFKLPLVYASSSSVYGLNSKIPFCIEDPVDKPASFYGATKRANELMAFSYHHLYGISATGLRFFTVYGPWGRPDMAPLLFTQHIYQNLPIDIYNHGNMQRDFTYIDDIVNGILSAIKLKAACEIFNLGNNKSESISSLVEYIEHFLNKKAIKNFLPMQLGDIKNTYADIEHSRLKLGYNPHTSLQEGISKLVTWFLNEFITETKTQ